MLIAAAAIGYGALAYKKFKLRNQIQAAMDEQNSADFNNRRENAPILSTGQLMINGKSTSDFMEKLQINLIN